MLAHIHLGYTVVREMWFVQLVEAVSYSSDYCFAPEQILCPEQCICNVSDQGPGLQLIARNKLA